MDGTRSSETTIASDLDRAHLVDQVGQALVALHRTSDALAQAAAELLGINRSDLQCLVLLIREGPMTAGGLASLAGLTPGTVTALVDRLEAAGFARRVRDDTDRRRVLVELTDAALRKADAVYGEVAAAGRDLADSYDAAKLATVLGFLRREAELQQQYVEQLVAARRLPAQSPGGHAGAAQPDDD